MYTLTFLLSAALLSIERITYFLIWRNPQSFRAFCARSAVARFGGASEVLHKLFYIFKLIQISVFIGWCIVFAHGALPIPTGNPASIAIGAVSILTGQVLNFSVFYRLGTVGVFYGNKLGHRVAWCKGFPFSILDHPQYVGTLLSIWGFFLVMRYPHGDWVVLPLIETLYYGLSAYAERSQAA